MKQSCHQHRDTWAVKWHMDYTQHPEFINGIVIDGEVIEELKRGPQGGS